MDTSKELTDFDSLICDSHMQMIKAAIPYISVSGQQLLSIYIKTLELSKTVKLIQRKDSQGVGICSVSDNKKNPAEMLNAVKKYCSEGEREMLDLFMNFFSAFRMYNSYREIFPNGSPDKSSDTVPQDSAANPLDTLKSMLTPEQQSMLDTYSALFNTTN